ncbi:MAG: hypothetical protein JWN70_6279 [Planctomycetaceae bacterium]|nr:hypothetical protein [Planctomycetaceae bacterium]
MPSVRAVQLPNRCLAMWLACSIVWFAVCSHATAADPLPTMRTIRDAWAGRQDLVKSVRLEWRTALTYTKGSLRPDLPKGDIPATDVSFGFDSSVLLSESMMRYSSRTVRTAADGTVTPIDYVSAADGALSANMMSSEGGQASATIFPETFNTDRISGPLFPALMFLRPASKKFPLLGQPLEPVKMDTLEENVPCVVIGDNSNRYWLDPARGFVVLRWESFHPKTGWISYRADISYQPDPKLGWIPKAWSLNTFRGDNPEPKTTLRIAR